jgi:hypothetical protein
MPLRQQPVSTFLPANRSSSWKRTRSEGHRFSSEALTGARHVQVRRIRSTGRMVTDVFEVGGKGALARHRVVRRRPHSPAGVDGTGQPHHGPPAERERRPARLRRHADDRQPRMRNVGQQHHQRKHQRQALHEHDMGEPSDSGRPAERAGTARGSSTPRRSTAQATNARLPRR